MVSRTKDRSVRDIEILAGRRGAKDDRAIRWSDLDLLVGKLTTTSFAQALSSTGGISGTVSGVSLDDLAASLINGSIGDTISALRDDLTAQEEAASALIQGVTEYADNLVAGVRDDVEATVLQIDGRFDTVDQAVQDAKDGASQRISDEIDAAELAITEAFLKLGETQGIIADAGIVVDPDTGTVTIGGLSNLGDRLTTAEVALDGVNGQISQRVTYTEMNVAISAAMLDPSAVPIMDELVLRMSEAEIELDAQDGRINLKADTTIVEGMDLRLGTAELAIDSMQGAINLLATSANLDDLTTTLNEVQLTLETLDAATLRQSVTATRSFYDEMDDGAFADLGSMLNAYSEREEIRVEIATAHEQLSATISDEREARTAYERVLAAQIDAQAASIRTIEEAYASDVEAVASQITTLKTNFAADVESIVSVKYISKTDADGAIASALDDFETTFGDNENIMSAIANGFYSKSDADTAIANGFTNYRTQNGASLSQIDANYSAISTIEGWASASYTLRVSAGGASAGLEIVAADDPINGPASSIRIDADNIIMKGTLHAEHIATDEILARHIYVDGAILMDETKSALACGKTSARDFTNDGIYFGRMKDTSADDGLGFGFFAGRKNPDTGLQEYIQATNNNGLKIVNARFFRNLAALGSPTVVTTTKTVSIGSGRDSLIIVACGGGQGGGNNDRGTENPGAVGTDTVIKVYDGTTLKKTFTAPAASSTPVRSSPDGEKTPWGKGGNHKTAYSWQGGSYIQAESGGYGAGGAAAGGLVSLTYGHTTPTKHGGNAADIVSFELDISSYSDPSVKVTIGEGGTGRADGDNDTQGGNGGGGRVEIYQLVEQNRRADVVPIDQTSAGTFSTDDLDFPDLGPGWWHIDVMNNGDDLGIGELKVDSTAGRLSLDGVKAIGFFAARTPRITTKTASRTVYYRFHKMGD